MSKEPGAAAESGTFGLPAMLAANVSWRNEPGVSRAYTWLDDGTVVGYRDLLTGIDHPASASWVDLLKASVDSWLGTYGVPHVRIGPEVQPLVIPPRGGGLRNRWRRRKALRQDAANRQAWERWWLDHPTWRVPIDPPNGGWRDLVRNEAGEALWQRAASLPAPGFLDLAGRQELRAWRTGALGEETVARELWQLSRSGLWRHLHSVPVGSRGSDIDHILIGPGGVFTLNTKNHQGANIWVGLNTFMINGQKQPYLRNSRHEAERASKLLTRACGFPVNVRAVVVVVDPRNLTIRQNPTDVAITTRRRLKSWISSQRTCSSRTRRMRSSIGRAAQSPGRRRQAGRRPPRGGKTHPRTCDSQQISASSSCGRRRLPDSPQAPLRRRPSAPGKRDARPP